MGSANRVTTHRDPATSKTPHRRLFVRALCEAMTRDIDNILAMETSATATATMAGEVFSAASLADLKRSTTFSHEPLAINDL